MQTTTQFVTTNGIQIHIERSGGAKPALFLLHGITDNGRCMLRLAEHLAIKYDVILVDARGHGLSDAPEAGYSADHHADDLLGLLEALGIDKPIVYGHSMGARTAARFAAQHPERVRAVILEDPVYIVPPSEAEAAERQTWLTTAKEEIRRGRSLPLEAHLENAKAQGHPDWRESDQLEWAKSKLQVRPQVFDIGASMAQIRDDFPRIQAPVLILKSDDPPEIQAQNRAAAALIPQGKIIHVRRDNWKALSAQLDAFLNALPGL